MRQWVRRSTFSTASASSPGSPSSPGSQRASGTSPPSLQLFLYCFCLVSWLTEGIRYLPSPALFSLLLFLGGTPTHRHFVIFPHLQMDDIFSLFSKFFQHLAHFNGWSFSPYSSASFDIWCSPNDPSAHVVQYKKQQQKSSPSSQIASDLHVLPLKIIYFLLFILTVFADLVRVQWTPWTPGQHMVLPSPFSSFSLGIWLLRIHFKPTSSSELYTVICSYRFGFSFCVFYKR